MNPRNLLKFSLIAALLASPISAQAGQALSLCDNSEAILAKAVLNADVIVWGEVKEATEQTKKQKDGKWEYSWTARIEVKEVWMGKHEIGEVWMGKHEIGEIAFSESCSGTAHMSRNHCSRPPATKGTKLVIYLKKDIDGKHELAQPRSGVFNSGDCPGQVEIDKARKQHPKV
ncbi:MAG: hypothetical protein JRF33_08535, partial [Deltaproteobacteria bacterium]|nr:hypothetical protein [Deltaproteobacteria bacterium]